MIVGSVYRKYIKVFNQSDDTPKTGLADGDFDKVVVLDASVVSETVTVSEVDASNAPGLYVVEFTPAQIGYYRINISVNPSLYVPSEFFVEEYSNALSGGVSIPPPTSVSGVLADLIVSLRLITRDTVGTDSNKLWSDYEWIEYLNDAEREICRRAHVLEDYSTSSVCSITLSSGVASYSLHPKILYVKSMLINYNSTHKFEVSKRTRTWLNENYPGWELFSGGFPQFFIEEEGTLVCVPAPGTECDGKTATLTVSRLPIVDLSSSNTTPSIHSRHYDDMKLWALYRAFSKHDSQTFQPEIAKSYYDRFENNVGSRPNVLQEKVAKQEPEGITIMPYRRCR